MVSVEPEGAWICRKDMVGNETSWRKPGWRSVRVGGEAALERTTSFLLERGGR